MSLSEYMAAQAAKKDAKFGKIEERKVEDDGSGFKAERKEYDGGDAEACIFHAYDGKKKNRSKKEAREGWKNADDVLKINFVESVADEPARKGGKGDRDGGRKGGKGDAKTQQRGPKSGKSGGFSADLSNDAAFPSLG